LVRDAFSWNNGADVDDELDHAAPEAIAVDDPRRAQPVELRRYRLRPGRRDELIELFDRELLQPQETVGLQVLGQFRDADEPDQFVWLRGFGESDPDVRARSLEAFYTGPTWAAHGPAANATMLDSDDVLLLRPAREDLALEVPVPPATALSGRASDGIVLATTAC